MLKPEQPYDFKKDLLQVHKKGLRDFTRHPEADEFELTDGIRILLPPEEDIVIEHAARDFWDYLLVSMDISATVSRKEGPGKSIRLVLSQELEEAARGYMGYRIEVKEQGIVITGYDNVGIAQALYFLEDLMNLRKAPFLKLGITARKALFTFRSSQSPFGMFEYPDEALALIAHRGYNVIPLWMKDAYTTKRGEFMNINLLCQRAKKYGIRVYAALYAPHNVYPDDPGAEEYYDKLYGEFFTACPDLAGITLIGEACGFCSRDPRVSGAKSGDNIPSGKPSPGWWPCNDYHKLVRIVKKAVQKYKPDADIVISTYNWGWAPEEERIKFIVSLPDGISVMATWDMFQMVRRGNSYTNVTDYTLQFAGPGDYFLSEVKAIRERGLRLYCNANTAGRTWDFGVVPYEPMPFQWIRRYERMQKVQQELGMTGIQENIHYGFQPSIIGDLEKWAFFGEKDLPGILDRLLERDFGKDADAAREAFRRFSEGITHHSTSWEDQYTAFRVGPSYPFWLVVPSNGGKQPPRNHAMFGNGIYVGAYPDHEPGHLVRQSMPNVRIHDELAELKQMDALFLEGIRILEGCTDPNRELLLLLNLSRFLHNTTVTGIHNKEFYLLKQRLHLAATPEATAALLDEIEALLRAERQNAEDTIPIVQLDSRLGWEPSMEYTTDEQGLRWKLRQVDHELNYTLAMYRRDNSISL